MGATVINYKDACTFGGMLDKITEDSTLSFIYDKELYFKRFDKILKCPYNKKAELFDYIIATEVTLSNDLIQGRFFETNIGISDVVTEIGLGDIRNHLYMDDMIMMLANNHCWFIYLEDNVVILDYGDIPEANDDNYREIFFKDVIVGILEGQWFVLHED